MTNSVRTRAVVGLARFEAWQLARSLVVVAGFVAGGLMIWLYTRGVQPLWWRDDWVIGTGQTVVSVTVLIAAQLATARARRDGLADLYASFPSSARRRTLAHLIGLLGTTPAALVLIGVAAGVFEVHDVLGTPDVAVLVGGVLLVIAGGAIGVAIGSRFPHPLAGVIGGLVWFVPFIESNQWSGAVTWMFPWVTPQFALAQLPGPLTGYPPGVAHAAELAGITVLAGAIAIAAVTATATTATAARRKRVAPLAAAAAALAAIVVACVVQAQPIPTRDLDQVVSEVADAGSAGHCTVGDGNGVRYCLYPEFDSRAASLRGPVDEVLAQVPTQRARTLTISQFSGLTGDDTTLTHGHSKQQIDAWTAQLQGAPANLPSSSALYVNLGSWPAGGQQATDARFALALGVAEWAVGLPTNSGTGSGTSSSIGSDDGPLPPQCVPLNQAREAIAIWLAAQAATLPPSPFQDRVSGFAGNAFAQVDGATIVTWSYSGSNSYYGNYLASPGPQDTAAGYLLAQAMTNLPTARVAAVLAANWGHWTGIHTTNAQLAAALGITMPTVPAGLLGPGGQLLTPPPGAISVLPQCTT